MGVVSSIEGDIINVLPRHKDLKDHLPVPKSQLQKYFRVGDHVKVLTGSYINQTGLIVKVVDNIATIISDVSQQELKVLISGKFLFKYSKIARNVNYLINLMLENF